MHVATLRRRGVGDPSMRISTSLSLEGVGSHRGVDRSPRVSASLRFSRWQYANGETPRGADRLRESV